MQAIANTAGFHFAYVEQGGSSLYSIVALKATSLEVLRIIVSIRGVETNHFSLWHDKAGNAVAQPLAGVAGPQTGVTFPDLNAKGGELNQTNPSSPNHASSCTRTYPAARSCDPRSTDSGARSRRSTASPPIACSKASPRSSSAPSMSSVRKPTPLSANSDSEDPRPQRQPSQLAPHLTGRGPFSARGRSTPTKDTTMLTEIL
jgi:hypothetical protein